MSARRLRPPARIRATRPWRAAAAAYRSRFDDTTAVGYQLDGEGAESFHRQGRMMEKREQWLGAAAAYRHAIVLRGEEPPEWMHRLGRVLERSGDWYGAREAYRRAAANRRALPPGERPKLPELPLTEQIDLALIRRPDYAHCILKAAKLAAALGIARISVIEFGVAGGNGLVAMETHSARITGLTGVAIDVIGFDTGEGLFAPRDFRDMPYHFSPGSYAMDVDSLMKRLEHAELVFGDAAETFPDALDRFGSAPIGAMSFDMDYYSATAGVLGYMGDDASAGCFLPRVSSYFDDVVGNKGQEYNEFTGELLAIDEFNAANSHVKLVEDRYFRSLPVNFTWHHSIYTMHRFEHPSYSTYVRNAAKVQLPLSG
ncbi:MAG: hypothetical protein EA389_14520 [Ilumatobacter sp.]|nr:MAG: hypothetical protein EA389_14520 [Ilumatobacter sp.]